MRLIERRPGPQHFYVVDGLPGCERPLGMLFRHSVTHRTMSEGDSWTFALTKDDVRTLTEFARELEVRAALICGSKNLLKRTPPMELALLAVNELRELIVFGHDKTQTVRVVLRPGASLHIFGRRGAKRIVVPRNRLDHLVAGAATIPYASEPVKTLRGSSAA